MIFDSSGIPNKIFEGVFGEEIWEEYDTEAYESNVWRDKCLSKVEKFLDNESSRRVTSSESYLIDSAVLSILLSKGKCNIYDIGGGLGHTYFEVLGSFPTWRDCIGWTVLENKSIVSVGKSRFNSFLNLEFREVCTPPEKVFDILHFGSVIQYFKDWKHDISSLLETINPRCVVVSDGIFGPFPTFVSLQEFYGRKIPYRFLNYEEFRTFMESIGYKIVMKHEFRHALSSRYFGNYPLHEEFPMDATINVILVKEGEDFLDKK